MRIPDIATRNGRASPTGGSVTDPVPPLWPQHATAPTDPTDPTDPAGRRRPGVYVAGVRGGVGTSTIARAIGGQDGGVGIPAAVPSATVVLVTSPSVSDTAILPALVDRCRPPTADHVIVAVVSDGHGRWPAATRARMRMLRGAAAVVAVPWVARWRWQGADEHTTSSWLDAMSRLASTVGADLPEPAASSRSDPGDPR
jgi:hypothetical protein